MKKTAFILCALLAGLRADSAPLPYPVTIDSRAQTAPPLVVFRGSETAFRVTFKDGSAASDISGHTPFFSWSTNASAACVATSSWTVVSATNGVVDFRFAPQAMNFAPGRYLYEVGVRSNNTPRVYRQGTFQILGSPQGSGAGAIDPTLPPVDWTQITWLNLPGFLTNETDTAALAALYIVQTNLVAQLAGKAGTGEVAGVSAFLAAHTNRTDNPHAVTAAQLGALTAETDAAALAALAASNAVQRAALTNEASIRAAGDAANAASLSAYASTNRPAAIYGTNQWIDGDGRIWQLATVAGAAYYEITGGGLGSNVGLMGERWTWLSGNTYTNATRPASPLSWAADMWELVLSPPGHYYEGAADAGTLTLADGNFDNEIIMTRMTPTVTATNLIGLLIRTTDVAWTNAQALAASALQPPATQGLFSASSAAALTNGLIRAPVATNAARAVIAGTVHTNQLWGASGTNAQYRMSWDITNGTFKVEEILP